MVYPIKGKKRKRYSHFIKDGANFLITKKVDILNSLVEVCDLHASRLHMAYLYVKPLSPFSGNMMSELQNAQISFVELLISRFTKLQDTLSSKLFPLILDFLEAEEKTRSFLDILHQMEKVDLLKSTKDWLAMRTLRNHLTQEYPNKPDLVADNLNKAIVSSCELLEYWTSLKPKVAMIREKWIQKL